MLRAFDSSRSEVLSLRTVQSTVGGPKWTKMVLFSQNGPKSTIFVHFGLANAKIQFGIIRPF